MSAERCGRCDRVKATEGMPATRRDVCWVEYGIGDTECLEATEHQIAAALTRALAAEADAERLRGVVEAARKVDAISHDGSLLAVLGKATFADLRSALTAAGER